MIYERQLGSLLSHEAATQSTIRPRSLIHVARLMPVTTVRRNRTCSLHMICIQSGLGLVHTIVWRVDLESNR